MRTDGEDERADRSAGGGSSLPDAPSGGGADRPLDLLITGGRVVTPDGPADLAVGVRDGRIAYLGPGTRAAATGTAGTGELRGRTGPAGVAGSLPATREHVRADGLVVLPGLVDPHVHLGLPMGDQTTADDPDTGTAAALAGGVTTVADFTLHRPGRTLAGDFKARRVEFDGRARCDFTFHANVTEYGADFAGRIDDELAALRQVGGRSLKVFTCYEEIGYAVSPGNLRVLLTAARRHGLVVLVHAEDGALVAEATTRLVADGRTSPRDYPASRPAGAEAKAVRDVIDAARDTGAPVYFVHVSTAAAVAAIREARALGDTPLIRLETCPQYLLLEESLYEGANGAQYLVAPPLRTEDDRRALREALRDGTVDVVATDHCCFRRGQKDRPGTPFTRLPRGLPGVETRLALVHALLARSDGRDGARSDAPADLDDASWRLLVEVLAAAPARILGLADRKGSIRIGADADLVLFAPGAGGRLDAAGLRTATDFSPYAHLAAGGQVTGVYLRGLRLERPFGAEPHPAGTLLA
ncbi:MAG: amidohydrolase family protein [Candidatus Krumholzibacteriia bacterium]